MAWGLHPATRRRGPKPAHSAERIVAAAIEVADEDGFAGLSMPKIAARLDITANALYRYVRSKDELLVLLAEAGWGPPPQSVRQATTWRTAATEWTPRHDRALPRPPVAAGPTRPGGPPDAPPGGLAGGLHGRHGRLRPERPGHARLRPAARRVRPQHRPNGSRPSTPRRRRRPGSCRGC
ncbi:TetR/AcrR family transcriptional regulator [Nonomuraea typhae]|uniref:TetR/AcrR family transcriptional regulator n=1 Tax=Nonomuraea typhae TaxID=2603600 RepID=UPI003CCD800E